MLFITNWMPLPEWRLLDFSAKTSSSNLHPYSSSFSLHGTQPGIQALKSKPMWPGHISLSFLIIFFTIITWIPLNSNIIASITWVAFRNKHLSLKSKMQPHNTRRKKFSCIRFFPLVGTAVIYRTAYKKCPFFKLYIDTSKIKPPDIFCWRFSENAEVFWTSRLYIF